MKRNNYFILFVLLFVFSTTKTVAQHIDAGPDQTLCNGETEVTLHAEYSDDILTGRYRVEAIPFNWIPIDANAQEVMWTNPITGIYETLREDDKYSDAIPLPFSFNFFGRTYNQIFIGTNGDVMFEPFDPNDTGLGRPDEYDIAPNQRIPNHTLPYWYSPHSISNASIMGAYHDIDIRVQDNNNNYIGDLKYVTVGTAPNRKFVIIYRDIPHFNCNDLLTSQQIVLNESDNSIEVHVKQKPICTGMNKGRAILGIQNEELAPCGYYPGDATSPTLPNRNNPQDQNDYGTWEVVIPEAYKFVPDANVTIKWSDENRNIVGTEADVTVPINQTTTYTLEVNYEDCHANVFTEVDEVTVTKLPVPDVSNLPAEDRICQNETKILDGTVQNPSDYTSISYEWVDENNNDLGNGPKLTINGGGTYTVIVTVNGNCSSSFTDVVTPYQFECRIPEAISPNGDGNNDQWFLDYLADQTGIAKVEIFDRRGVLVYDKADYVNEFVGKNNDGEDLPSATYFYVIKLKDGQKLSGWLYVSR